MFQRRLIYFSLVVVIAILLEPETTTIWAQFPNYRVSSPESTHPNEVTIAINPIDPTNLAAGANLNYAYYSFDGGRTWTEQRLSSTFGVWGDPCVVFDNEGNLYYGHLSNPVFGYWIDRIVVQKSTDGGRTWSSGVGIGFSMPKNQDKEWLAVDYSGSPYHNSIYMAWTEFDEYGSHSPTDSSRILFSRSTDYGQTWSTPVRVSDRGGDCVDDDNTVEGAVPAVGPNGEVYLAWSGPEGIMFDRSLDGGKTFGKDIFVTEQPGGWAFAVSGIYRSNGLPVTLCDISYSPLRGTIYIVWSDQRYGTNDTDVWIIKSTDGGDTWSGRKRVNDDHSHRHQFFHWATVDPVTGKIYVVFYDRRNTTGDATEVYVARSDDGGETFENFKVSETPFTPVSTIFFGDYTNIAAYNGKVYPIWMRMDGTRMSIWTAIIDESQTAVPGTAPDGPATFHLEQNYPNPFNGSATIPYSVTVAGHYQMVLYNLRGEEIQTLFSGFLEAGKHQFVLDGNNLPSGLYIYALRSSAKIVRKKCLLIR